MDKNQNAPPRSSESKRRFKGVLLAILSIGMVLVMALPLIVPERYINEVVAGYLSSQLDAVVQVEQTRFSWRSGLSVTGLDVRCGETNARLSVLRAEVPFEPLRLLRGHQISGVRADGVVIELEQASGLPKWLDLEIESDQGQLPIRRILVSDLVVHLTWPDAHRQIIQTSELELLNDAKNDSTFFKTQGRLVYATEKASMGEEAGRFSAQGELQIVQQCLAGTVEINWEKVNLKSLRAESIQPLDLASLEGISDGKMTFTLFPDLNFHWEIETTFANLKVQRQDASVASWIGLLQLGGVGSYDPVGGLLDLQQLKINSPVFELFSNIQARIDEAGIEVRRMDVSGHLEADVIPQMLPAIESYIDAEGRLSGLCRFDLEWKGGEDYLLKAAIEANGVEIHQPDLVDKSPDVPLKLSVTVRPDEANPAWMMVEQFGFIIDAFDIQGSARLPRIRLWDDFESWLERIGRLGQIDLEVVSPAIERLGRQILPLEAIFSEMNLSGPTVLGIGYAGGEEAGRIDAELELAETSTLRVKDYFSKPEDERMGLTLQAFWPWEVDDHEVWCTFSARGGSGEIRTNGPVKARWAFSEGADASYQLEVAGNFESEFRQLDYLFGLSPMLKTMGWDRVVGGTGKASVEATVGLTKTGDEWRVRQGKLTADLNADQARIDLPGIFLKAEGTPFSWTMNAEIDAEEGRQVFWGAFRWQELASHIEIVRNEKTETLTGNYTIDIGNLPETIAAFPVLAKRMNDHVDLDGRIRGSGRWSGDSSRDRMDWQFDATETGVVVDRQEIKAAGIAAKFSGEMIRSKAIQADESGDVTTKLSASLGESFFRVTKGTFALRTIPVDRWLKVLNGEKWLALLTGSVERFDVSLATRIDTESHILSMFPELSEMIDRVGLTGWVDLDIHAGMDGHQLTAQIQSRLDELGMAYRPIVQKDRGTAGDVSVELSIWPDGTESGAYYWSMEPMVVQLGPIRSTGSGHGRLRWFEGEIDFDDSMVRVGLEPVNLSELSALSEWISEGRPEGSVSGGVTLERKEGRNRIGPSRIEFDKVQAYVNDQAVAVEGVVDFSSDYSSCEQLILSAGDSSLTADWSMFVVVEELMGSVNIRGDSLDVDQLYSMVEPSLGDLLAPLPATQEADGDQTSAEAQADYTLQEDLMARFQPIRLLAQQANLLVSVNIGSLRVTDPDPESEAQHHLTDLVARVSFDKDETNGQPVGRVHYWSRIGGGWTNGEIRVDLTQENPTLLLESMINDVEMSPEFQPIIDSFFPGLVVSDRLTIIEKETFKSFTTSETTPNYPVGEGRMIFVGGYLEGRAGPEWVMRIFPGLNTMQYRFIRMHNWFTKREDGVVHNTMIFLGRPWNLYIVGDSRPGGFIEYEVGVDLLARYESEYWSSVGQGRIPLFTTTGRIVDRRMEDQQIRYVLPHEVAYRVFVKNNAITGAYRLLLKRIHQYH